MYIKKVDGKRAIKLPGGGTMTRADLPDPATRRWVASRKAAVVRAVQGGLIAREEARAMYALSDEEYASWEEANARHGEEGLKATRLQQTREG
ncbi:DUF1153 domain-containing protein [Palleronia sediminis]|uniref:DUF1153 domain-containing protein n=1 Tax=Palleronia sediminis TaxID=2547833 RepID=A0A4R6APJ4_9RHOB|nr:DUF1153 domain-containing protein [Palleronia sediminis]TDL83563.1 DUF1153 domain-containing protein [Palleronia sediminis]